MEVTRAEIDAIYDAAGRLVVTPHALTVDGQRNVPADLRPGESLEAFLERHVDGIHSGAWVVSIGGAVLPRAMWAKTFPKHGQLIACRATVGKSALQLVAIAVLSYFTMGAGAAWIGTTFGVSAGVAGAIGMGMFMAGSVLINKVLGPKVPSQQTQAQKQVYSLSDQRNSARPYEPVPVLWGEMRVTPDLASKSYAWYEGDDQYLSTILLGGINVQEAFDLAVGATPIGNYSDVSLYFNGFPGMASQDVPLYSNVDAVAGAEFVNGGDWITRTGSAGAGTLQLDIEGQLYDVDNEGNIKANTVVLTIEARLVGASAWTTLDNVTLTNASTDVLRRTFSYDALVSGQYEVRAKLGVPRWNEGGSADACKFAWVSLKSVQADTTDYSQWGRIGIKIRASGQLSGSLDTVRATYRAKPMPIWTGAEWATATTRANGLSNPGAILLQTLRGIYANGVLQFGFGLTDEQIDIEGLKAFMLHCAARGYTYDKWITGGVSLGQFCQEVALAGMGEFAWTDGSRPTAVFVSSGQPVSAVVNMANMLKASFSVDYALSKTADGIEYQYVDRDNWETKTLRVMAPGVTTMLNPARVTGEGITSEAHAAVLARYHLAQSLYQFKTIGYSADIEHLDYRRLSIVSVSHDLTQWGFGGRLVGAEIVAGKVRLTLDEPVPPLANAHVGLRVPGARDYRVWTVQPLAAESNVLELVGDWPAGVAFPGGTAGNPAHDTLWCYDFKATPGYRVRVTSMEPEGDLNGAKVTCVPEGPEFWDYVLNGTYVPAPNGSSIPQLGRPTVKNLRVAEKINLQGDTEWYELSCIWDVEGEYDHAQVWAGRDGSELRLVDGSAQASRSTFRIDGAGEWLIEVRPFNAGGQAGQSVTLFYITTMTQLPPRNPGSFVVQQIPGGLRRFAWMWTGDKPKALAGVQIRYLPGDVPLSTAGWSAMQPLGEASDIYTAQLETTKPGAGLWTFGLRAIDTAGRLANGVVRVVATLDQSFDQIQSPDLTPPPAPTGLAATAALATVMVSYDAPVYTQGHGHGRTRIYAAKVVPPATPALADAKQVADAYAGPVSFSSEPATSWFIWARHESVDGVLSAAAGPVMATTGADVSGLLTAITGQLTQAQMTPELQQALDNARALEGTVSIVNELAGKAKQDDDETLLDEITRTWENRAVVREEMSVTSNEMGHLQAQWSVRMALSSGGKTVVGGVALNGTAAGGEPTIDFGVLANKFYVAAPEGAGVAEVVPFYVQAVPTTINGVVVPAGVYMDAAYINNVTALWGRFGNLVTDTIQATAISAGQLTAGNGVIGGSLKSANYVAGSSGWTLRPDGVAEFSGVIVRGAIYSTAGTIGGITINANGLNAGAYSGYAWPAGNGTGFHLGPSGLLLGNYNTGKYLQFTQAGEMYAPGLLIAGGNATFWGNIAGASGTFSGTLTAQEVITTGNLQRNSATVAVGASANNYLEADWDQEILALTVPAADGNAMYFVNYAYVAARVGGQVWIRLVVDGVAVHELKLPDNINGIGNAYPLGFTFMFAGNGFSRRISLSTRGISNSLQRTQIASRNISVIISKR